MFPSLFSFFCFCNATFYHSGNVTKPPQPSSAFYGTPLFTGNPICHEKVGYNFYHVTVAQREWDWRGHGLHYALNKLAQILLVLCVNFQLV